MDELDAINLHWGESRELAKDKGQRMGLAVAICPSGDKDYVWTGTAIDRLTNPTSDRWCVLSADLQPPSRRAMQCSDRFYYSKTTANSLWKKEFPKFKNFYFKSFIIPVKGCLVVSGYQATTSLLCFMMRSYWLWSQCSKVNGILLMLLTALTMTKKWRPTSIIISTYNIQYCHCHVLRVIHRYLCVKHFILSWVDIELNNLMPIVCWNKWGAVLNCNRVKKRMSLKRQLKEDSSLPQILSACSTERWCEGRGQLKAGGDRNRSWECVPPHLYWG